MSDLLTAFIVRASLPPRFLRYLKGIIVYPRYYFQLRKCREGFERFGRRYPKPVLFIAGLPKCGTTWMKRLILSFPGFHELLIPDVTAYELRTFGSHDYELPFDMFCGLENHLVLMKMHIHGSQNNAAVLFAHKIPYIILYRDLRDAAVSYFFYVRQTPWHPHYPSYKDLSVENGLRQFAYDLLPAFRDWIYSWQENRDPDLSLVLRYEDMLADSEAELTRVAEHFGLDYTPEMIRSIVENNRFSKLRRKGARQRTFFRKGIAGDWRNHFTPELTELYKHEIGKFLIEFGYERGYDW